MFHIQPTPISWVLWAAMFAMPVVIILLGVYAYFFGGKKRLGNTIGVIGIIAALVVFGLAASSKYYNYIHSSSYIKSKKTYQLEYNNNQKREIVIKDYQGKVIYQYTGSFSFDRSGHGVNLVDNKTGKKTSIYIGDNATVIVTDK